MNHSQNCVRIVRSVYTYMRCHRCQNWLDNYQRQGRRRSRSDQHTTFSCCALPHPGWLGPLSPRIRTATWPSRRVSRPPRRSYLRRESFRERLRPQDARIGTRCDARRGVGLSSAVMAVQLRMYAARAALRAALAKHRKAAVGRGIDSSVARGRILDTREGLVIRKINYEYLTRRALPYCRNGTRGNVCGVPRHLFRPCLSTLCPFHSPPTVSALQRWQTTSKPPGRSAS